MIDVVSDANVVLKWFREEGEEVVDARALLSAHRDREIAAHVLDLTFYELGNALIRGAAATSGRHAATVLEALRELCPVIEPTVEDLHLAAHLADEHALTLYDGAYAAVAQRRGAHLATLDGELLKAGLGRRPSELVREFAT